MCYNIAYLEKKFSKLAERYKDFMPVDRSPEAGVSSNSGSSATHGVPDLPVYYFVSGFSHPLLPVVSAKGIEMMHWGLIPFWTRDADAAREIRTMTLNAKGETVFEKPAFREAVVKSRVLLPVNGFFEWQKIDQMKYPYFISMQEASLFSLACVSDTWVDKRTGEVSQSFSILTTQANELMARIHNVKKRMPVIIPRQHEHQWLSQSAEEKDVMALIRPVSSECLTAFPVSRKLNNTKSDRNQPFAIEKAAYIIPEPGQSPDLFS